MRRQPEVTRTILSVSLQVYFGESPIRLRRSDIATARWKWDQGTVDVSAALRKQEEGKNKSANKTLITKLWFWFQNFSQRAKLWMCESSGLSVNSRGSAKIERLSCAVNWWPSGARRHHTIITASPKKSSNQTGSNNDPDPREAHQPDPAASACHNSNKWLTVH